LHLDRDPGTVTAHPRKSTPRSAPASELLAEVGGKDSLKAKALRWMRQGRAALEELWPTVEVREFGEGEFEYLAVWYEPISPETPWMRRVVAYADASAG
jgi:hypothetical protein